MSKRPFPTFSLYFFSKTGSEPKIFFFQKIFRILIEDRTLGSKTTSTSHGSGCRDIGRYGSWENRIYWRGVGHAAYMAVGQFQYPPCRFTPFWKIGLRVLATPHAADNQKTPLWLTVLNPQWVFFVFHEKTCFLAFFPIQIIGAVLAICIGKTGQKMPKNTFFFSVKNEKHLLVVEEGGPKWCFLIVGGVRRSKKHLFSR